MLHINKKIHRPPYFDHTSQMHKSRGEGQGSLKILFRLE